MGGYREIRPSSRQSLNDFVPLPVVVFSLLFASPHPLLLGASRDAWGLAIVYIHTYTRPVPCTERHGRDVRSVVRICRHRVAGLTQAVVAWR